MRRQTGQTDADPLVVQSIDGCLDTTIGAAGLAQSELDTWLGRLERPLSELQDDHRSGKLPLLRVPEATDDIAAAQAALARLSEGAQTIVFFGTGGSSLGGQALAQLAGWNIPGGADAEQRKRPRTRFYDNLDALTLERALASFDLSRTRFVVVSKSGGTPETMVQAVSALQAVIAAGLEPQIPRLFLGVTEPAQSGKANALRSLFESYGVPLLDHHTGIGGRFSGLTNVGLLPALARGLDVHALRGGAKAVVDALLAAKHPSDFAPAIGAATAIGLNRDRGIRVMVMMPYADRLGKLSEWYVQLWAESLGKDGQGTHPFRASVRSTSTASCSCSWTGRRTLHHRRAGACCRHGAAARSGAVRKGRPRLHVRPRRGRSGGRAGAGRARGPAARGAPRAHLRPCPA